MAFLETPTTTSVDHSVHNVMSCQYDNVAYSLSGRISKYRSTEDVSEYLTQTNAKHWIPLVEAAYPDSSKHMFLLRALDSGNADVVSLLLENGCSPWRRDTDFGNYESGPSMFLNAVSDFTVSAEALSKFLPYVPPDTPSDFWNPTAIETIATIWGWGGVGRCRGVRYWEHGAFDGIPTATKISPSPSLAAAKLDLLLTHFGMKLVKALDKHGRNLHLQDLIDRHRWRIGVRRAWADAVYRHCLWGQNMLWKPAE